MIFQEKKIKYFSRKSKSSIFYLFQVTFCSMTKFTVWLPLLYEILDNMCIVIISFQVCEIIQFEINFTFVITPLSCMTKKVETKINLKIFKTKAVFKVNLKAFFITFKMLSRTRLCFKANVLWLKFKSNAFWASK